MLSGLRRSLARHHQLAVAVLAVGLLFGGTRVGAQTNTRTEPPVVVVQGEGVVRLAPDQAFITLGAESRSRNPKEAQAANAEAMNAVQQKLAAAGVPKEAIRTVTVSLQLEYDYANGRQTPRGYVARNVIEVRVDALARLGEIMDAAVGSGATSIQGLRFDLKERAANERDALTRAVRDGMARAEAAASGANSTIDRVIRIEEHGVRVMPPVPIMADRVAMTAAAPPPTPVAEGEIEIRAAVTVTVAIK
jgi:uncharacterized protein YggE